jgi:hypothetical protein
MIDEDIAPELEALLRTTLAEMIPKVMSPAMPTTDVELDAPLVIMRARVRSRRPMRRLVAVGLVAAASIVALAVVVTRNIDQPAPGDSTVPVDDAAPAWYRLLRPLLPEHFDHAALTMKTDRAVSFTAIDLRDGKALEIALSLDPAPSSAPTTTDSTGIWEETPQGFTVITPAGMFVEVSCDIGARGRDFAGPPNYCEMSSTAPFAKAEIRALTVAVANTFDGTVFRATLGSPVSDILDHTQVVTKVLAVVPSERTVADRNWGPADRILDFSTDGLRPVTSIRVVSGVFPRPSAIEPAAYGLYDDSAAFWIITPAGVAIRVSTTDPTPPSLAKLEQLALGILNLGGTTPALPTSSTGTVVETTTTTAAVEPAPQHLLPATMPAGFDSTADSFATDTEGADASGVDQIRLFATSAEHPAVLMVFISPTADRAGEFATIKDLTSDPKQPSFRLSVTLPSGKGVMFASGGLTADELQQIADGATDDPVTAGVSLQYLSADLQEITWHHDSSNAHAVTWTGPNDEQITMNVEAPQGIDVIGNALSWPITAIDTPNGRAFISIDATDPQLVQAGVVIGGQVINVEAHGVPIGDVESFVASIVFVSDTDWSTRVPEGN